MRRDRGTSIETERAKGVIVVLSTNSETVYIYIKEI